MRFLIAFTTLILLLVQRASGTSFIALNETTLRVYCAERKIVVPKDLGEVGSVRPHHETFLWRVARDIRVHPWGRIAAVSLIGDVGGDTSIDRLINYARTNPKEASYLKDGYGWALVAFSNRGFDRATQILLSGVREEFWKELISG